MATDKLRQWLEIIGLFSVVASLVFVGLQMKQSHEIALSQASQARGEEQSLEEQAATGQYALAILFTFEDQFIQYSNGFLSEERWNASKVGLKRFLTDRSTIPVRFAYERAPARYSVSFQEVMDGLIAESDSENEPK